MEFKGNQSNTNHASRPHSTAVPAREGGSMGIMRDDGKKKWMIVAIAAVVVVVLGLGLMIWKHLGSSDGIKKSQYQAVFLTNGQVYFCKLSQVNERYIHCADVYYLQVQQSSTVQPADNKTTGQTPQVSLAKLGNELHGPENEMAINRDQVLFWENLKDNGKVVEAIKKNQAQ